VAKKLGGHLRLVKKYVLLLVTVVLMLSITTIFVITDTVYLYAQSTDGQTVGGFSSYVNPDYAIKLQYPQNWEASEQDLPANGIVTITAPDTNGLSSPARITIGNYILTNQNTVDEFVDFFFKERYQNSTDYRLINSTNTSLAGMEARQFILYDYDKNILGIESTGKVMRVLAVDNKTNNGYSIKYWAEPSMYNKYLPVAQKMIESLVTNYNSSPTDLVVNTTTITTDSNEIHPNFTTATPDPKTEDLSGGIDFSNLPQFLTVIAETKETDFPLSAVIGPNSSSQLDSIEDLPSSTFDFRKWNPKFTFQFVEGSAAGLQVAKSVLIGQIKSYDSIDDALDDAKLWRDVPLNEQSVLRLDHEGLNFIIVEVDFTNSLYGLYPGVFEMQTAVDKSYSNDRLRDELREDRNLEVVSASKHNTKNDLYWEAVTPLVCDNLRSFGFQVCE
jgi:hypothetical protein